MKATITYITIDTEGQEDLVLAVPQITRTLRELAAPAAPRNGTAPTAHLVALPATAPAAGEQVSISGGDHLPGVTIRPPAETVATDAPVKLYDHCQDPKCGKPKPATKSPFCHSCAVKRGVRARQTRQATRHNDNAEN